MLERDIQKKTIIELEKMGYYVVKLEKTNKNGIPDLLALKNEKALFFEIKTEKTKARPLQEYRMKEITDCTGCKCYVVRSLEQFKKLEL